MEIKFFDKSTIKSGQDVKAQYRDLIKKHHPDVGGSNEDMKTINAEYEFLLPIADKLEQTLCEKENRKKTTRHEVNDGYREVIQKIIFLDGLIIEIIGSWVWVSGNSIAHKEILKENAFNYSGQKKAWYWYKGITAGAKRFKGHYKLDELRDRWGSAKVESESNKVLTTAAFSPKYQVIA